MDKIKIGIIGCGNISSTYMKNCQQVFGQLEVVACSDILPERAKSRAAEFGIPKACTNEELLADPEIQIVLNITPPKVHAVISLQVLEADKNVYSEKPLAVTRHDGEQIIALATAKGLRVGCAPDTFLGGGLQTCRKLIDDGWIGKPVAATAFMMSHGPESWHPNPEFVYEIGAGPLFDMGPYYLTALVSLIGPVIRISGSAAMSFPERTITSPGKYGEKIKVEVPTHVAGTLDFANGAVGSLITSFDVWDSRLPRIEIYGSEGTLAVPDPNTFGGPVWVKRQDMQDWQELPLIYGFAENCRGIGLTDMAYAIRDKRPHRASGEQAFHVLDLMQGFYDASGDSRYYKPVSGSSRPEPMPSGIFNGHQAW